MSNAVIERHEETGLTAEGESPVVTADAAECRTVSVAKTLDAAYQRASTLQLTPEEIGRLRADFTEDDVKTGAGGKAELLYIEHASIRERLFDVFGPGQWSLIPRRMWSEDYTTAKGGKATRVYVDCVLVVRGVYVGEANGAGSYFHNNAEQNYGDAVESAQSEALRRVAAKSLGVGLQVWKKSWCAAWKQRQRDGQQRTGGEQRQSPPKQTAKPAPAEPPATNGHADVPTGDALAARIKDADKSCASASAGAVKEGELTAHLRKFVGKNTEPIENWPADVAAKATDEMKAFFRRRCIIGKPEESQLESLALQLDPPWNEGDVLKSVAAKGKISSMTRSQCKAALAAMQAELDRQNPAPADDQGGADDGRDDSANEVPFLGDRP